MRLLPDGTTVLRLECYRPRDDGSRSRPMILSSDLGTCDIEPQAWSYFPDKSCLELLVCVELMAAYRFILFLDEHKLLVEDQEPQIFRLCLSFSVLGAPVLSTIHCSNAYATNLRVRVTLINLIQPQKINHYFGCTVVCVYLDLDLYLWLHTCILREIFLIKRASDFTVF